MLKRPSTRRKSNPDSLVLNLVPMLDALVTIVAFLLITMSFINMVSITSPVPIVSEADNKKLMDQKPLQLTVSINEENTRIWSVFKLIPPQTIPNTSEGGPDLVAIHDFIVGIKQKFPNEKQVVISPHPGLTYDTLIAAMDAVREIEKTDPPIYTKNPATGLDQEAKDLFPDVVFGNLLGGG